MAAVASAEVSRPVVPADPAERLAVARKAYADFQSADSDLKRVESILSAGPLAAKQRGVSRLDQFTAWNRRCEAEAILRACLEPQS